MTRSDAEPELDVGPEWEESARNHLSQSDYDTELGVELSKDARKVVNGEMTDAEFHEKHHEAMMEEFGVDERVLDLQEE